MQSRPYENLLLRALSKGDQARLAPELELVELDLKQSIELPNAAIKHVYFPESGFISVVAGSKSQSIEAGLIGREGMTGAAVVLGDDRSPNHAFVQLQGSAHRLSTKRFRMALEESPALRRLALRYAHVFMTQVAQTAFANGTASVEHRLARWLLMAQDREAGDELHLTHEFISIMLGVRRSGVTDALHELERKRFIRGARGVIQITNRRGLITLAGAIYGVPEAQYERLIGSGVN